MNRPKIFLLIALSAVLFAPFAFAADNATGTAVLKGLDKENTKSALEGAYDEEISRGTELATKDKVGEGIKQLGKAADADAADLKKLQDQVVQQPTKGISFDQRKTRKQLIKDSDKAIGDIKKQSGWCDKIGKVLDVINVVAIGAQAAGYAAEGDMHGAKGVIVDETTKRVTTAAGAVGGTFVGGHVGAIVGAGAAEEFHGAVTKKIIEKGVDNSRVQDAKDKMLGNGLAPVQIMTPSGTRTLPNDMTLDPTSGNIVRKTPEQLQADREKARKEFGDRENAATSTSPLDIAEGRFRRGEISQAEFDRIIDNFNNPNRVPVVDQEDDREDAAGEAKPDEAAIKEAKDIPPVQVRGTVAFDGDYSYQGIQNIVRTVMTVTFWNVGSLVPDYGAATVTMANTSSLNGVTETVTGGGSFSGGPNGVLNLNVGGKNFHITLVNGSSFTFQDKQGTIDNPAAFLAWEK